MEEDFLGIDPSSYRTRLLEFLEKEIPSLSSQSKTLISQELLSSAKIRYRDTPFKSILPARIFDDLLICKQRAYFTINRAKAITDVRMLYEKKHEVDCGKSEVMDLYFKVGNEWYKIVGIPDCVYDNLVVEFTITRDKIKHLLGRAVVYAYMCMKKGEYCATLIVPTTFGEVFAHLVVPNSAVLDYLSKGLEEVINERFKAKRIPFCSSCLYRRQCPVYG
ncbi:CRISPR-associated protein [Sulfurisphaera ohwakuensis]|uniref:CRISPR-associated protein n=1 Tax=Sulfurisphaera ohwakuensis TaxID=69656 RepID=UPI0036F3F9BA